MSTLTQINKIDGVLTQNSRISGLVDEQPRIEAVLRRGPMGVPMINGVPLVGNISLPELGLRGIYYDTKANWNAQSSLIGEAGYLYIYSDYQTITDQQGNPIQVPGIKVGDGVSYLIDSPFMSDVIMESILNHINDTVVHITAQEREFWNNKVTGFLSGDNTENLVLSKRNYVTEGDVYDG